MTVRQSALSRPDNVFKSISKESLTGVKIEREVTQILAQSGSDGKEKKGWEAIGRGRKQKQKPAKQMKNK